MSVPDRGFLNLLGHLRRDKSTLPLETIQAAVCHYLVHLPATHPVPTPLVASVIASPLWRQPSSLSVLLSLSSVFRRATNLKHALLQKEERGIFGGSIKRNLSDWIQQVLDGLENGDPVLKLAVSGGILSGLNDLSLKSAIRAQRRLEECAVLSFTEVLKTTSTIKEDSDWEKEFHPCTEDSFKRMNLALLLASHFLPFVSEDVFSALRLRILCGLCLSAVQDTFRQGAFLKGAESGLDHGVNIVVQSPFSTQIEQVTESDSFVTIAPVCRLLVRSLSVYVNNSSRSKRTSVWETVSDVSDTLESIAASVEADWRRCSLASVRSGDDIAPDAQRVTEIIWNILKTLLFSTVMLQQAVLDVLLHVECPIKLSRSNGKQTRGTYSSAADVSTSILRTLMHLCFVVEKFGGVSSGPDQHGFSELRKVFYLALDILSANPEKSESFVKDVCIEVDPGQRVDMVIDTPFANAKRAYVLACVEQLIPVVGATILKQYVLPLCEPHLDKPAYRDTFESAHSVMLSIFAAHANTSSSYQTNTGREMDDLRDLARQLVPGYVRILLENAREGNLTTPQFRLAYSALVRSAGYGRIMNLDPQENISSQGDHDDDALSRLCVDELLRCISSLHDSERADSGTDASTAERDRLHLTLISLLPNVTPNLLPYVLSEIEYLIDKASDAGQRHALLDALFEELIERVGDAEKESVMRWWFVNSARWSDIEERDVPCGV